MVKKKYKVFNKSSINMDEVADNSVDYVITSPPYNIGCKFDDYIDKIPDKEYFDLIEKVICQIADKLKKSGLFIIDIADCIILETQIFLPTNFILELCSKRGLNLIYNGQYYFDGSQEQMIHSRISKIVRKDIKHLAHSPYEQILVFQKAKKSKFSLSIKPNYILDEGNEAFWSKKFVKDLLKGIDCNKKTFLDPFMGKGTLGVEVIKNGGYFIGYDIVKSLYAKQFGG
jgi:DNA modification methylase